MNQAQASRRHFLKISALLPISGLLLSPAIASIRIDPSVPAKDLTQSSPLSARADIRNVDFDSHNFMWNFR